MPKARSLLLTALLLLTACASAPLGPRLPPANAKLHFQNGQEATLKVDTQDLTLRQAFLQWAKQGVYTQAPVYRQLPGVFILTGKPRLAGQPYVQGPQDTTPTDKNPLLTHFGQVGLIIHADGSVGPEMILQYGVPLANCCEAPRNIRIGSITSGRSSLGSVQRGDNLSGIAIQP